MASPVDGFTRIEELLRWNMDPAQNGKGRIVNEYDLRCEVTKDGVLVLSVAPTGFGSEAMVFGVTGNGLATDAELAQQIAAATAARLAAEQEADAAAAKVRADEEAARQAELAATAAQAARDQQAAAVQAAADFQSKVDAAVNAALAARGLATASPAGTTVAGTTAPST